MKSINASVAILTLNSAKTLPRCLASVKHFAEIIVCDGNSTDDTVKIAKKFGAKIVPQFESLQKNKVITDKAAIRNRAYQACTFDWHYYLDSDDELSPELVAQIAQVTRQKNPLHLIYRMPFRHILAGKIITYSSNYPLFQNRLFHRQCQAKFVGPIHEKISFNQKKYPVGTLSGYYNIHWEQERINNFWQSTILPYTQKELNRSQPHVTPAWYRQFVLKRQLPEFVGTSLRVMSQYILHGFKDTMPVVIEFARLRGRLHLMLALTQQLVVKYIHG